MHICYVTEDVQIESPSCCKFLQVLHTKIWRKTLLTLQMTVKSNFFFIIPHIFFNYTIWYMVIWLFYLYLKYYSWIVLSDVSIYAERPDFENLLNAVVMEDVKSPDLWQRCLYQMKFTTQKSLKTEPTKIYFKWAPSNNILNSNAKRCRLKLKSSKNAFISTV